MDKKRFVSSEAERRALRSFDSAQDKKAREEWDITLITTSPSLVDFTYNVEHNGKPFDIDIGAFIAPCSTNVHECSSAPSSNPVCKFLIITI
jgi:hypothetical protein